MPSDGSHAFAAAVAVRDRLTSWLHLEALPTWAAFGVDHVNGGFHEVVGLRCEIEARPRRVRVVARQIFSFAVAGRLGWGGPWRRIVDEGLDWFLAHCVKPDGTVRMLVAADGKALDDTFNLYDQAFALFALAAAASVASDRAKAEDAALKLRAALHATWKHPVAGFEEASPRTLPLKANPHMHMFEACLAWEEAGGDATWSALADEIAELCLAKLIDPAAGGWLKEFFDGDWAPMPGEAGRIVEPGHHFEWAWLLTRWGVKRSRPDAIRAAGRLVELGEEPGVDRARGVAIMEMLEDGGVRDGTARLWSQTERLKGHVALAGVATDAAARDEHFAAAAAAGEAMLRFFDVDTPGLWRDRMEVDGSFRVEPAPASSFYHVICAIEELEKAVAAGGI
ncbi:AGE family epimerase/isomerase [Oharaeibacter diazotrophicus]|uniref:Mannose-6-phosphate isomerase type 3 n=1 Tax=Oharaeibacter diazotrophicus TaxID=1920512 RepID=A0A4R6RNB0_9HYPH|nr:AGE family epimerase/isomerase [Oharaeibacter diazotrophicus]TDP87547.1 mannose-6-phosphate isomerase type 3 [Oharaeibacter diazotrophicus]BBE70508.1 cellobiose 2-epimerase [Pleomorphomonas sp. SM30]GLS77254.1 AGE family epimerase/isomerase [Oharaeibacter diazotrophicus]